MQRRSALALILALATSARCGQAWAKDGADDGGPDGGSGSGHDDVPTSSHDHGADDANGDGGSDSDNSGSGPSAGTSIELRVRYEDGFEEFVRDGVYWLVDGRGRLVVSRRATSDDIARMRPMQN